MSSGESDSSVAETVVAGVKRTQAVVAAAVAAAAVAAAEGKTLRTRTGLFSDRAQAKIKKQESGGR